MRSFAIETLKSLAEFFDICIFTRQCQAEAVQIVMKLDPTGTIISSIISESRCFQTKKGHYLKDLRIINSHNLEEIILVDSESFAFSLQIDNGICLMPWSGDAKDCELSFLSNYLQTLSNCPDVRKMNLENFHLSELASKDSKEFTEFLNF